MLKLVVSIVTTGLEKLKVTLPPFARGTEKTKSYSMSVPRFEYEVGMITIAS
jgi:hypothetical protein